MFILLSRRDLNVETESEVITEQDQAIYTKYRVIKNDCRGFNNLSYTIHLR
jgi:hypothetical protein